MLGGILNRYAISTLVMWNGCSFIDSQGVIGTRMESRFIERTKVLLFVFEEFSIVLLGLLIDTLQIFLGP